jgi:spermidine/putrescine-binding protein
MSDPPAWKVLEAAVTRRRLLGGAGSAVLVSLSAPLLAACGGGAAGGGSASSNGPGQIKLGGYEGWIGKNEFAGFAKANPGSSVQQVVIDVDAERITKMATDPSAVDIMLLTEADVGRLVALDVVQDVDLTKVPNYRHVDPFFKFGYASEQQRKCVATDYGKTGFGYRKDLVKERPTSWADMWKLAPKYTGKVTLLDYEMHTIGSTLKMLGYSGSSKDQAEIQKAGQKLVEIKPHLQSFTSSNTTKGLLDGSVVMASDWDYDIFSVMRKNPNIEWVTPEDGSVGYLDTWVPINRSKHIDVVWKFFDYHFAPKNYAGFINTTGAAFCESAARKDIDPAIAHSPVMYPPKAILDRVEFLKPVGTAQQYYDQVWQQIKAA